MKTESSLLDQIKITVFEAVRLYFEPIVWLRKKAIASIRKSSPCTLAQRYGLDTDGVAGPDGGQPK